MALSRISDQTSDIDTRYAYISYLAYAVFRSGRNAISTAELDEVSERYFRDVRIRFSVSKEVANLVRARILVRNDGVVFFKYKYVYCYFVARYFSDHAAADPDAISTLNSLSDRLHVEDHANIVTFYLYKTRNMPLIQRLLSGSRRIYSDCAPVNLESDVTYVNKLMTEFTPLELPAEQSLDERREAHQRKLDEATEGSGNGLDLERTSKTVYSNDLEPLLKLSFALKTLNVLGQVLRNFPGSLPGDTKAEIAKECYLLGLRTLKCLFAAIETNLDEFRQYLGEIIKDRPDATTMADRAKKADEVIVWLSIASTFGVFKRVASAVGLEQLKLTYKEVLNSFGESTPASLIDIVIKLDHFRESPVTELSDFAARTRKNHFVQSLTREFVANYLYLYRVDPSVRQQLGQTFKISSTAPKYLQNPSKR